MASCWVGWTATLRQRTLPKMSIISPAPLFDELKTWHDFFLLAGGASATLLGLVFVSIALVANLSEIPQNGDLFASPIVTQFTSALVLSTICLGPWQGPRWLGGLIMALGIVALARSMARIFRFRRFQASTQETMGFLWLHIVLAPLAIDLLCTASGLLIWENDLRAIAGIAVTVIALNLLGLRNTWNLFLWMLEQHHRPSRVQASEKM